MLISTGPVNYFGLDPMTPLCNAGSNLWHRATTVFPQEERCPQLSHLIAAHSILFLEVPGPQEQEFRVHFRLLWTGARNKVVFPEWKFFHLQENSGL